MLELTSGLSVATHCLPQSSPDDEGLIPRCIDGIFQRLAAATAEPGSKSPCADWRIRCSFMQIYEEAVYDLLADRSPVNASLTPAFSKQSGLGRPLRVRWSLSDDFYAENLFLCQCDTASDAR